MSIIGQYLMSNGDIRFALIGCGRIGERHARLMAEKGKLVAVCDNDEARAQSFGNLFGVKHYHDHLELLDAEKNLDVVAVCTPNGLHARHSIDTLHHRINVLCEKPMSLTTSDCQAMIRAAEDNSRRLFVVKQNRYNPPVIALKQLLDNSSLGVIYSLQLNCFWNRTPEYYSKSWKGTLDMDGGALFTQFSHFIDLLFWLFGDVSEIQASVANTAHKGIIETEDTGVVILQFVSGILATINYTVNSFRKNMEGSLTVFGEKGTVKIGGQYLNQIEYWEVDQISLPSLPAGRKPNDYGEYKGSMSNHDKVYDNVIAVLQQGAELHTSPADGLKTVEIINRIYREALKKN